MTYHCVQYIDYSVREDLIPRPINNQCPRNSYYMDDIDSCNCEDHCGWRLCRLVEPPDECILGTFSKWEWDNVKNGWIAQVVLGSF